MDPTDFVKRMEGWNPRAYWDKKQWSIGYGTRASGPDEVIDEAEGRRRLATELDQSRGYVTQKYPNLAPHQTAALTSFTYNLGPGWMNSPTRLRAAIESGDYEGAARVMREYNKAGGEVLPGLVKRRDQEAAFFLGGPTPAAGTAQPSSPAAATGAAPTMIPPMQPMTPYSGPSPDDVAQQRRMAQMLMQQATSTEPVGHWTQALARVVQGGVGGMYRNAAQEGERQGREAISSALGGTLTPAAAASNPWLGDLGLQMYKQQSSATPLVIPEGATAIVPDKANPGQFKPLTVGQPKRSPDMQNYQEYAQGEQAAGRQPMSFMEYQLKLRQAGATAITNDMRGENAEAAGIGQGAAKRANDTLDRARAASTTIRRMVDLQTRLDQIDTGKLAPGMATIGAWAKGVGVSDETLATMGIDPKLPGTAESIKAVTGRMVVDMIGAGGFPANNFSDADRAFLLETVPRLANTPLGNRLIIEAAKRAAAVDVEKGKALQEWRRNNKGKSVDDFELEWSDRTARMDLMGDLRQEAEKLVAQSGGQRADTRSLPRVNSPAEAARLPKGTEFIDPQGNIRKVP